MIVKAKDQVNDAFNLLFTKDSSLNKVKNLQEALAVPTTQNSEKLKIGSLTINGLPLKRVVSLSDSSLKILKSNLTIFAH